MKRKEYNSNINLKERLSMREIEVTIQSAYPLKGTLTLPTSNNETHAAILIVSGTGESDRDGNVKGMKLNIYKDLAQYMDTLGFVTLRYDKRGTHQSGGDFYKTGLWDLIDDAASAIRFLKEYRDVDESRIIILGHSEGAVLAPAIHHKEAVSGLILLSGLISSTKEMLFKQNEMLVKEIRGITGVKGLFIKLFKVADRIQRQKEVLTKKIMQSSQPVMMYKGVKVNAKWYREHNHYNIEEYLRGLTIPVLAVTGDKDVQVPPEDVKKIDLFAQGDTEWHIIPNMNHMLRKYEKNHTMLGLVNEYKGLVGTPMDSDLEHHLRIWLSKHY